jgi:radical SAM-linked protein
MDSFSERFISVAMPSMRVGTLTPRIMEQVKRVRKTGFTLAPEAGSERLRRVINKGITEEDLLEACRTSFSLGWSLIKFYFMIGLPTETREDIEAIVELVKKSGWEINKVAKGKKQINVSIGTFVPKPHTPFQWTRQLSIEESRERISYLRQNMPRKGCNLKWQSPEQSFLEGVFSRGDRRLAALIHSAWLAGARLDGWCDHFNLARWREAAATCELGLEDYLRQREQTEILPWQHLETGVEADFLIREWDKAVSEVYTPDCRYHGCQQCGLCDFDTIRPIVHSIAEPGTHSAPAVTNPRPRLDKRSIPAHDENHCKYIVHYSRFGNICYLGHLEFLQLIFRALRRAGIITNFTKGFNPTPKVSFSSALPVGTHSNCEFFLMDLPELLADARATAALLSSKLPPGLDISSIELHSGDLPQVIESTYTLQLPHDIGNEEAARLQEFMAAEELVITRVRKGKERQVNIRPLITSLAQINRDTLVMKVVSKSAAPGIKPSDALQHIFGMTESDALAATVTKTGWVELPEKG